MPRKKTAPKLREESAAYAPQVSGFRPQPSALVDTRVIYCGDNLEQLKKLPDACVDLSFGYFSDALREIDRFFKEEHRIIIPLTVREILDEEIERKLA